MMMRAFIMSWKFATDCVTLANIVEKRQHSIVLRTERLIHALSVGRMFIHVRAPYFKTVALPYSFGFMQFSCLLRRATMFPARNFNGSLV